MTVKDRTLADLLPGETATVRELRADGFLRNRLLDFGLVPGTKVEGVMSSPLGDPVAYLVRGTVLALRREDAEAVILQ